MPGRQSPDAGTQITAIECRQVRTCGVGTVYGIRLGRRNVPLLCNPYPMGNETTANQPPAITTPRRPRREAKGSYGYQRELSPFPNSPANIRRACTCHTISPAEPTMDIDDSHSPSSPLNDVAPTGILQLPHAVSRRITLSLLLNDRRRHVDNAGILMTAKSAFESPSPTVHPVNISVFSLLNSQHGDPKRSSSPASPNPELGNITANVTKN